MSLLLNWMVFLRPMIRARLMGIAEVSSDASFFLQLNESGSFLSPAIEEDKTKALKNAFGSLGLAICEESKFIVEGSDGKKYVVFPIKCDSEKNIPYGIWGEVSAKTEY